MSARRDWPAEAFWALHERRFYHFLQIVKQIPWRPDPSEVREQVRLALERRKASERKVAP